MLSYVLSYVLCCMCVRFYVGSVWGVFGVCCVVCGFISKPFHESLHTQAFACLMYSRDSFCHGRTSALVRIRLWQQLFPDVTHVFDCMGLHDPAPDTEHLGLSSTVLARLVQQHSERFEALMNTVADIIGRATRPNIELGFVCRPCFPCTYIGTYMYVYRKTGARTNCVARFRLPGPADIVRWRRRRW